MEQYNIKKYARIDKFNQCAVYCLLLLFVYAPHFLVNDRLKFLFSLKISKIEPYSIKK